VRNKQINKRSQKSESGGMLRIVWWRPGVSQRTASLMGMMSRGGWGGSSSSASLVMSSAVPSPCDGAAKIA
jgi:hypothetical protein